MLKPATMAKVVLVGLKSDQDAVLSLLHDLKAMQVEPVSAEVLKHFTTERTGEVHRALSDELLRFKTLVGILPPGPIAEPAHFQDIPSLLAAARAITIDATLKDRAKALDALLTDRRTAQEELEVVKAHRYFPEDLGLLTAKSVLSYLGEGPTEKVGPFLPELKALSPDVYLLTHEEGKLTRFVVAVPRANAEGFGRLAQKHALKLTPVPPLAGTPEGVIPALESRLKGIDDRIVKLKAELAELGTTWRPKLLPILEQLEVEARKTDIVGRLGGLRSVFAVEGWVPERELPRLRQELERVTAGRTHVEVRPDQHGAPTLLDNPKGWKPFEFFIRFYSLPQSGEIDPTFIFTLVFPVFFGLMLGDVGYGVFILIVCLWLIWRVGNPKAGPTLVPKALVGFLSMIMPPPAMKKLAKCLIPGCLIAIVFGVFFDSYFGFTLSQFTHGALSMPASLTFSPVVELSKLLLYSGFVGLFMVTAGLLFGILNAFHHHNTKHMVAKVGWIMVAWGITFVGLTLIHNGATEHLGALSPAGSPIVGVYLALIFVGIPLIALGEGGQALIELPGIVSHILSYTRLVGILLASVILALVIDKIADGMIYGGGSSPGVALGYLVFGLVILVGGQMFNIVLGVFEPGIQGARLIYVEHFSKFYQGNGQSFAPFGGSRRYTRPQHAASPPDGVDAAFSPPVRAP